MLAADTDVDRCASLTSCVLTHLRRKFVGTRVLDACLDERCVRTSDSRIERLLLFVVHHAGLTTTCAHIAGWLLEVGLTGTSYRYT